MSSRLLIFFFFLLLFIIVNNSSCSGCKDSNLSGHWVFCFTNEKKKTGTKEKKMKIKSQLFVCGCNLCRWLRWYIGIKKQCGLVWRLFQREGLPSLRDMHHFTTSSFSKVELVFVFPWERQQAKIATAAVDTEVFGSWHETPTASNATAKPLAARVRWC